MYDGRDLEEPFVSDAKDVGREGARLVDDFEQGDSFERVEHFGSDEIPGQQSAPLAQLFPQAFVVLGQVCEAEQVFIPFVKTVPFLDAAADRVIDCLVAAGPVGGGQV